MIKLLSSTHSVLRNKKGKWIKMCVPLCMQKEVGLATQVKLNHKLRISKIVSISSVTHHLCAAQLAVSLEAQNIAKYKIVVSYKKKYFV